MLVDLHVKGMLVAGPFVISKLPSLGGGATFSSKKGFFWDVQTP